MIGVLFYILFNHLAYFYIFIKLKAIASHYSNEVNLNFFENTM